MRSGRASSVTVIDTYEAVGGRALNAQERELALDVWAQLRGKDMQ